MGDIATPFGSTYCASKAAITKFSDALRIELDPFNVKVIIVKPGGVRSDIAANAKDKLAAYVIMSYYYAIVSFFLRYFRFFSKTSIYKPIEDAIQKRSQASQAHPMDTREFAEKVVAKILLKNTPVYVIYGAHSFVLRLMSWLFPPRLIDWIFAKRFGLTKLKSIVSAHDKTQ